METVLRKVYVEKLQEEDIDWFVNVACTRMITEELKRPELLNTERLYQLANKFYEDGTAYIAKCGNERLGSTAFVVLPNLLNPNITTMTEIIWYVQPEHRHTRAAALLLKSLIQSGNNLSDETTLSLLPSTDINQEGLKRKGFHLEEYSFRKKNK